MTTSSLRTKNCALCGSTVACPVLRSTNAFGSPDLDLRPPEMERSSMGLWLQECETCNYVAVDISKSADNARNIVTSDDYKQISDVKISNLGSKFLRHALLCGNPKSRALSQLKAAWTCDDDHNDVVAATIRTAAADELLGVIDGNLSAENINTVFVLIDILRRCSRFDDAQCLILSLKENPEVKNNEILTKLVGFQSTLCSAKDKACYTVSEAN
ncbi:MAG: hypothetical protein V7739_19445 [Motiliproteus sp.]